MNSLHAWTERSADLWAMLAALGTLLAVGVAVWVAIRESGARAKADERADVAEAERAAMRAEADKARAEEAEDRRLAQARQVIAWVEHRPANPTRHHFDSSGLRELRHEHVLCFVNHSAAPIFDVSVRVYWQQRNSDVELGTRSVMPSGWTDEVVLPEEHQEDGFTASGLVVFRDLAGVRRRRWENGVFNELDEHGQEVRGPHR